MQFLTGTWHANISFGEQVKTEFGSLSRVGQFLVSHYFGWHFAGALSMIVITSN